MDKITLLCPFGDEQKTVEISQPEGGGDAWHITIDSYHRGVVFYRNGEWCYFDKWLMMDDVQAIGEIILAHKKSPLKGL